MKQGWEIKKLGEIAEIEYGFTDKANSVGDYRYIRITDIDNEGLLSDKEKVYIKSNDETKSFLLKNGDLLMARTGATFAKVLFYENFEPSIFASYLIRINFKTRIDNKFYWYFSKSKYYWEQANGLSTGAAQPQFNGNALKQVIFSFPKSLSEQQRIVSILDEAFAAIDKAKANAEQNLKNAKELFESYLQGIFEKKGDGWVEDTLDSLLEKGWIISHLDGNHGGNYPRKEEFKNEGVPYISANCLKGTNIDFSLAKCLSLEKAETFRKGVAINNDVLFAHNATVGPVAILKTTEKKVILGTSLTYYRCNTQYILPEYLANYMRSKEFKQQYELVMRQSTRNQVPITKQREFYHLIPPIEFQKSIVQNLERLLEQSQKLEAVYQKKIADLEELKKSILQKAFAGKLKSEKAVAI